MIMLFMRDSGSAVAASDLLARHTADVRSTLSGRNDLAGLQAGKLIRTLQEAARSQLHADNLGHWRDKEFVKEVSGRPARRILEDYFPEIPHLSRAALRESPFGALTRPVGNFLHYYESSGTTGDPVAAPKAVDDLIVNTVNIGEMWARLLGEGDTGLILINGPFAPAGYQFEKVFEYLGLMSVRLWADQTTGDYSRVLRIVRELGINTYVGAPSRLTELIQYALSQKEEPPVFGKLLLIAEQTGPHFLQHLQTLTGATARVASFGSSETGTVAVTCERGALHTQPQSYLLEVHDEAGTRRITNGRADAGELVVTTLDLPSRPLVRYRTGDLVEIDAEPCPCGVATPVLRPRGREKDALRLARDGVRQEDCEAVLWVGRDSREPVVLNYMLVVKGESVVCLVTADRDTTPTWEADLTVRLAPLFSGRHLVVRTVSTLPPLASMGAYVGWKLSRLVDLDDPALRDGLPAPLHEVVQRSLQQIQELTDLSSQESTTVCANSSSTSTAPSEGTHMGENTMTDKEKAEFVLGVYFRTQAAIERYMGRERLPEWTEHVARINSDAMKHRLPEADDQARDLLSGLRAMLGVYGSDTESHTSPEAAELTVRRCGIFDYREQAAQRGVTLTLKRPCEFCVDLHQRTAAHLGISAHVDLAERGCQWKVAIPSASSREGAR
jgi:phenylacetate-CoA ligase